VAGGRRVSDGVVLITGASGYLGSRLARHYIDTTDMDLVLPVRSRASRDELATALGPLAHRALFVSGDLEGPEPFADLDGSWRTRIRSVIHAAAVTRFNVDRDLAARVNVDGTAQVLALCRRCPGIELFAQVSTVYSTGLHQGPIREEPADDTAGFANAYEWSKWTAESLVIGADDLPRCILRVSTVVADDDSGVVTQYNAFHETLKLCFYGLLSLLPGRGDTPLYLVSGRFVVDAVAQLMNHAGAAGIYHVTHDRSEALTLEEVLNLVFDQFDAVEEFAKKRIMRPLLADEESFGLLVDGVTPVAGSLVAQALQNVTPFARQLYVNKELDNSRLRAALVGYAASEPEPLLVSTCRQLLSTRWGRRDVAR